MSEFQIIQHYLIKSCGMFCVLLAFFLLLMKNYKKSRRLALIAIEVCSAVLLINDALAYSYRGKSGELAFYMVRVSNFMVYLSIIVTIISFAFYLKSWLEDIEGNEKIEEWINGTVILLYFAIGLLIVSQTNKIYYSFDSQNRYQRERFYMLAYLIPLAAMCILVFLTVRNIKKLEKKVAFSLIFFEIFPVGMSVVQYFIRYISLTDISVGFSAIVLFAMAVIEQNYMLNKLSATEMRTGLPNSYGYFRWISILRKKESITKYNSYYFTLNDFDYYNRKYNSEIVLEFQKKYNELLCEQLSDKEIVANLGSDYYVAMVLKENTDKFVKLLGGIEVEIDFRGEKYKEVISASAGGYYIEEDNVPSEMLIGNASMALSMNKHSGRTDKVFIEDEIKAKILAMNELEKQIPIAMEKHEFRPFYQPKMSASKNKIVGAEALARWIKEDGQVIPPAQFIPILERGKEVCQMDFYMLRCVCSDLAEWIEKGLNPPKVSINLSRKNLANPYLVQEITEIIDSYNVPHSLIEVEISETLDEHPLEELNKLVDYLHRRGISVAIDDFGTGSSSMNLLRTVEFDILKIDKSFVDNSTERDEKVLKRIITIAKDIGLDIIAEGVESEEQLENLTGLGCDNIQGFYYAKPLPKEEFETYIGGKN